MSSVRASCRLAIITAAGLAAAFPFSPAIAGSPHAKSEIAITIFADHYVVEGRVIDDLDVLEKAVGSVGARTVRLEACGWRAERAQRAAAHRFRASSLELRLLEPKDPGCRASPAPREAAIRTTRGRRPSGIEDAVVDEWWHAFVP